MYFSYLMTWYTTYRNQVLKYIKYLACIKRRKKYIISSLAIMASLGLDIIDLKKALPRLDFTYLDDLPEELTIIWRIIASS
jgi:hypothetical protein